MKNNTLILAIFAVIVGTVAFFGGMQYQKMQRMQFGRAAGFSRQSNGGPRFGNGANRPVSGQIVSVDANGIIVKMNDGSTKIVVVSRSTSINKAATGTKADLKTGIRVAAFGTENSDGSITAQNIQLNPIFRGMLGTQSATKN